jgi:hypothetical protein
MRLVQASVWLLDARSRAAAKAAVTIRFIMLKDRKSYPQMQDLHFSRCFANFVIYTTTEAL